MLVFAAGAGFLVGPLRDLLFGVFHEKFALLRGFTRPKKQAYFITSQTIAWMTCIIFLSLSRAELLKVGRQVGFDPIYFSDMTGTVGIYPMVGNSRRFSYFVDLFLHIHRFKHVAYILVVIPLKVPSLYI